jgi:hypothetical protein
MGLRVGSDGQHLGDIPCQGMSVAFAYKRLVGWSCIGSRTILGKYTIKSIMRDESIK